MFSFPKGTIQRVSGQDSLTTEYGYGELVKIWNAAKRTGRLHLLRMEGRALLKGVIAFVREGGRIISSTLKEALKSVLEKLRVTPKRIILEFGEVRAVEMQNLYAKNGVFKWVPQLEAWLKDPTYKFWLGTLQINVKGFVQ